MKLEGKLMKKVLFASTALVAFAGAASADVALSGNAEMGIFNPDTDVQFFTDIDVTFTMSGETDGGLTFGAAIDIDETTLADGDGDATGVAGLDGILGTADDDLSQLDNGVGSNGAFGDNSDDGGIAIFISGGFGTLTMGDTDGALDWALTEVNFNSGSIADDETAHTGFSGNGGLDGVYDGQIARYDYTVGAFGFALSAEIDDTDVNDPALGIGFKYDLDLGGTTIGLGLGYQSTETGGGLDLEALGVSANAAFGAVTVGFSYTEFENHFQVNGARFVTPGFDGDHFGIGLGYSGGPFSANINYGEFDSDVGGIDGDGVGISVGYDLGGGAVLQAGYGDSDVNLPAALGGPVGGDSYSLGLRMNF